MYPGRGPWWPASPISPPIIAENSWFVPEGNRIGSLWSTDRTTWKLTSLPISYFNNDQPAELVENEPSDTGTACPLGSWNGINVAVIPAGIFTSGPSALL